MRKVLLLSHSEYPEKVVASAAKNCYSSAGVEKLYTDLTDEKTASFIDMLNEIGHESPIEHAVFTFGIEGVSRSLLAQLTRHRIASYSVKSQRYVREDKFEFVTPPEIEKIPEIHKKYVDIMDNIQNSYNELVDILTQKHLPEFEAKGLSEKEALKAAGKLANEDARFILPNACETKIVVTMNARSLKNFFKHRCCNRAQWEIRALAWEMLKICKEVCPHLFAQAGPPCAFGACPEGKMSCGKAKEVRKFTEEFGVNK